jgi:hypothetical protein
MILGRDLAGTIDALGAGVDDFAIGDAVYGYVCDLASSGTYAQYVSVPAELLARKPASLSHAQAAAVPVAGITASIALRKARAGPDTSVFIAGGAGVSAASRLRSPETSACELDRHPPAAQAVASTAESARLGSRPGRRTTTNPASSPTRGQQRRGFDVAPGPGWRQYAVGLLRAACRGRQPGLESPRCRTWTISKSCSRKNASFHSIGARCLVIGR